jgi:BirA family biotin operon repressor/biotin-[acetyl-CoA-carboxylase] ligase
MPEVAASAAPSWLIDLPTCPSTNTWALERIDALAHGACVWTERQSAGRGRNGAIWHAPSGVLTASFVLDLPATVAIAQLALCAGLAVAHAVEDLAPAARVRLKWPNDCYLDDRKLAGVLCERPAGVGGRRDTVVVGIGLNLDPRWDQTPGALPLVAAAAPACVAEICIPVPGMVPMLTALRRYLLEATGLLAAGGWRQLLPHLRARDWLRDREVVLEAGQQRHHGMADGLDDDGGLRLRDAQGGRQSFTSATVLSPVAGGGGQVRQ